MKQDITRLENEKTDLGLELSFVRDKLQQKTAAADNLEIEVLELGAKLDKSTRDYVGSATYALSQHLCVNLCCLSIFAKYCTYRTWYSTMAVSRSLQPFCT